MQKRILIVTDAWKPQVNGVVTTLTNVSEKLREMGLEEQLIEWQSGGDKEHEFDGYLQ